MYILHTTDTFLLLAFICAKKNVVNKPSEKRIKCMGVNLLIFITCRLCTGKIHRRFLTTHDVFLSFISNSICWLNCANRRLNITFSIKVYVCPNVYLSQEFVF